MKRKIDCLKDWIIQLYKEPVNPNIKGKIWTRADAYQDLILPKK